ncbi:MAG TPA: PDZ domain-containing protein, partial [Planctomycetota bacterium]|nr:PDZ domain-containing protein [Planctomycetota bacterium]
ALGPFDYDGPVRTKSLWWAEGVTNYYTNVLLARAGLMSEAEFLAGYRNLLASYVNNPATRTFSPEETSWTVWDGPYLQGPVNYYDQGEVLGLLMDAEIRAATDGRRSLDDAVRLLYRRFSGARGFQSEDLIVGIRDATGVDLHAFFLDHVSGAKEPDWTRAFAHLGVRFDALPRLAPALTLTGRSREDGGIEVTEVPAGSTAERFGLRAGDVITTVDGKPATTTGAFARRVRELGAGAELKATVRRDGKETALVGTLEPTGELAKAPLRADPESRGPRLGRLPAGAALDEAGFAAGDVLVRIGDVEVADVDAAKRALAAVKVGDRVRVVARRGDVTVQADVPSKPWIVRDVVLDIDPEAPPARHALRRALLGVKPTAPASVAPARKAG